MTRPRVPNEIPSSFNDLRTGGPTSPRLRSQCDYLDSYVDGISSDFLRRSPDDPYSGPDRYMMNLISLSQVSSLRPSRLSDDFRIPFVVSCQQVNSEKEIVSPQSLYDQSSLWCHTGTVFLNERYKGW